MSTYYVEHSLKINRPIERVRSNLIDYTQWVKWSPWLVLEPDASVSYNDKQGEVGASYTWSGVLIGAGSMELLEIRDYSLKMELTFEKPFKSKANIHFRLEELADKTVVTCHIDGKLPLYMFWIQNKMKTIMSMQYAHGLCMFKEYLEEGIVASSVHFEGVLSEKEQAYIDLPYVAIGKETTTPVDEEIKIGTKWTTTTTQRDILKLNYKAWYAKLRHICMGALHFASIQNMKKLYFPLGYEFYVNNPLHTSKPKLITEIYLPLK